MLPPERTFSGRAQVTAVDLVMDVRDEEGRVPADLSPEDFEVREGGEVRRVVAVESFRPPTPGAEPEAAPAVEGGEAAWTWRTVIYVDQVLSSSGSIRRATQTLAARAGDLTRLGTVEVVAADPEPRVVLPATRSARLVEQRLLQLSQDLPGRDAVSRLRKRFSDETRAYFEVSGVDASTGGLYVEGGGASIDRENFAQMTMQQEERLVVEQQDHLLAYAAGIPREGPRALMWISDGYDLDPRDFYLYGFDDLPLRSELGALSQHLAPMERFQRLVEVLSAGGWVCVNVALGKPVAQLFERPLDGLRTLAEQTGGELVTGPRQIPRALDRLSERVRLTYQVDRSPDGRTRPVEVRALRPGWTVEAPAWSGSAVPEAVSAARVRQLLEGGVETGDLPVAAAVGLEAGGESGRGTLQARVDLSDFPPDALPDASTLRVSFAVEIEGQPPFVRHDLVEGQSLSGLRAWTYTLPVSLPPQAGRVSVVVEELGSGSWGATVASRVEGPLPEIEEGRHVAGLSRVGGGGDPGGGGDGNRRASAEAAGYDLPVDLLPDPKVVVLIPPPGEMVIGGAPFETLVTRPGVHRVEFLLDGEVVETVGRAPFSARLDLGEIPRPRTVEAVARDAAGGELGRDSVVVNEGAGVFRVRLIEPRRADRVGPVDVEAEVRVPPDRELDRVEIAWNDRRVATLYEAPFRQRVLVPPESPVGYVGVTAYLADGSTAEDVIFMNGPGGDERVEVNLVELYTVVTDPEGRPMEGLSAEDFRVTEEGRAQAVAAVRPGSEMPLSLGLLLDSSASMADSLQAVQIAAIDFLYLTLGEKDRAFYVDFDSEPRLAQPLTGDLEAVGRQIVRARAGGYTALCDALVFGLVQMQSVRGRRALVVFSDGVGREERVGYATCRRVAQQVGVPIYAVVLDRTGEEKDRSGRIEEITGAVGGRVFYVDSLDNLGRIYRRIRQELGSQYLLTYYPEEREDDDFRRVEVEVLRPGLDARTVSGYWP